MKTFTINLNKENPNLENAKEIIICPLADIHLGDPLLDNKLLNKTIDYIKNNENVYTILNGDLMNTALKTSVSNSYEEKLTPMQQIEALVELLEPIKNKILVATIGNHENRIAKDTSIDIMHIAMKELGLGHRYTNGSYYLYLYFGKKKSGRITEMVYTIYGQHGAGGGRKSGSKLNRVVEMSNICIADVFLMSHVHEPIGTKKVIYIPDYSNKALTRKEMLFAISNSFLNYGGYAETFMFSPVSTSRIEIILNATERDTKIII